MVESALIRRNEVMELLNCDSKLVTKMVRCGVLTQIHLVPGGYAHYKRSEVDSLITGDPQHRGES